MTRLNVPVLLFNHFGPDGVAVVDGVPAALGESESESISRLHISRTREF